jgi:hypothetical protein
MASSGNFCTLNRLPYSTSFRSNLGKGNLFSNPGNNCMGFGTMALTSGKKWYMEGIAQNAYNTTMGIFEVNDANTIQNSLNTFYYNNTSYKSAFYHRDGTKYIDGSNSSYGATFAIGDVIGMAVDLESATNTITFYKNNASQGSFNLGTNGLDYLFCMARGTSGGGWFMNFGQDSTFGGNKTAGGNADANSFGDFFYAVPSGHLAVCSANLGIDSNIDPAQTDNDIPSKQFGIVTYTGNGTARSFTGLGFQPDMIWTKMRNSGDDGKITDSVRGVYKELTSNTTAPEGTDTNGVTAFGTDGFSIGSGNKYNLNEYNFVAWCWRAGGTASSNTDGTTTVSLSANPKAGFSIITYTGTGSAGATIGHGLSAKPAFIIVKNRTDTDSWAIYHESIGADFYTAFSGAIFSNNATFWNDTEPTTSVITLGTNNRVNGSSDNLVCYAWAQIEGYSKFGEFQGNGNADGPFIYTGFRPRMLFIKRNANSHYWKIFDTARNTNNLTDNSLSWDNTDAESSSNGIDILSNGFKLRNSNSSFNNSGSQFVYGAWGDVPFKYNNTF